MLLILALSAFIGLGSAKNFLEIPLQIEQVKQPIFPVTVGSRFEFTGVYKTEPSTNSKAAVVLYDDDGNQPLIFQLRMNYTKEPLGSNLDYFVVSSKYGSIYAGTYGYSKRYTLPMNLVDGIEIEIILEVTQDKYDVTINGVKSTESMINSRENVEYFESKTLMTRSSPSFAFKTAVQMRKIGEARLHLIVH